MSSSLDRLCGPGKPLKAEPPDARETEGLIRAGRARLIDARNPTLSIESRFDLAYNASHALCLAALRTKGYRSEHRYIVFQVLTDTLGIGPETWRVLSKAHEIRNLGEYEGDLQIDERILAGIIEAAEQVSRKLP